MRRPNLLLTVPGVFGVAAFLSFLSPPAPAATPDPLNPAMKSVKGPFRPQLPDRDQSHDPSPAYSEADRRQLAAQGKDLFFSRTAWGQQPSQGPLVSGQVLSCATCHVPPGFTDGLTHLVSPVREREVARRQTPTLLGVAHTAPYGWDGRNPHLQDQARGAIVSPLEMHASREPTRRELDALAEFQGSLVEQPPVPGRDYDPARASRGEVLFRTPRPVDDPSGEFPAGAQIACSTCHAGPFFTDGKAHRGLVASGDPVVDPGEVGPDGTIRGFHTPSLLGARLTPPYFHDGSGGDPASFSNPDQDLGGGAAGPDAARRALLASVLPFYNTVRFNFRFTDDELKDLAEFVLTL
ncbi:MAG TPA: cytochrome c peroxidase [Acidimicrobiia bacterium]|nr:cytochrome c peroxidase [Acidimicrobiia bacterium]